MQNTADLNQILLLIIAILLTTLLLYLATRIVTGKKDSDTGYWVKLLLSAILIWVLVIAVGAVIGALGALGQAFSQAILVIVFTGSIYIVKLLILPETKSYDAWERAIWITLLTFIFIAVVNYLSVQIGHIALINYI